MKTKSIKLASVFFLLFACVFAKAQVLESVSYTPAKAGKYNALASKSLTVFNGDVEVVNETIGKGEMLKINAENSSLSFDNDTTNNTISAARDFYYYTHDSIGNITIQGGTVNNLSPANIEFAPEARQIYGTRIEFPNITAVLNETSGKLNIDHVLMENPQCSLKWVRLPAYDIYNSENNYWFAYCEYNPCNSSSTPYYCNGVCQECPCGQVNIAANGGSPICGTWQASAERAVLLGTCTAGWNGTVADSNSSNTTNACIYDSLNTAYNGHFTCTNQTISRCASLTVNNNYNNIYGQNCANRLSPESAGTYTRLQPEDRVSCRGTGNTNYSYLASAVMNERTQGKYVASPSELTISDLCIPRFTSAVSAAILEAYRTGIRKSFCGFKGTNDVSANAYIQNHILNNKYSTCYTSVQGFSAPPSCNDYLPAEYIRTLTDRINVMALCQEMSHHSGFSLDNNNNFSCMLNGPDINSYKAIRVSPCDTINVEYESCTPEQCTVSFYYRPTVCKNNSAQTVTRTVVKKRPWCSGVDDCEKNRSCTNTDDFKATLRAQRTTNDDITVYMPQLKEGQIINCHFEQGS